MATSRPAGPFLTVLVAAISRVMDNFAAVALFLIALVLICKLQPGPLANSILEIVKDVALVFGGVLSQVGKSRSAEQAPLLVAAPTAEPDPPATIEPKAE